MAIRSGAIPERKVPQAKAKVEKASGSGEKPKYKQKDDQESTHEPKGPRGRPASGPNAKAKADEATQTVTTDEAKKVLQ